MCPRRKLNKGAVMNRLEKEKVDFVPLEKELKQPFRQREILNELKNYEGLVRRLIQVGMPKERFARYNGLLKAILEAETVVKKFH